jgi:glutamine synthetase
MTPEQVAEMGWDTKLPLSLEDALNSLETAVGSHVLDDLGIHFLKMYLDFKRLEVKQASEKTEEERLKVLSKIF